MFDTPGPRLFSLPPGADFPLHLVAGLKARLEGQPPEAMAKVTLFLNTTRMQRRVAQLLQADGAGFLPRLRLVTDLGAEMPFVDLPASVSPLRRRLELTVLIGRLLQSQPDLAPRSALYDLAESLAALMDEMQSEAVQPDRISALDVSGHSGYWARAQAFLGIIAPFFDPNEAPDPQARQRRVIEALMLAWQNNPPPGPMIVAGSTGSRGNTVLLMQAVARLPQGAIVLPGFDHDMPASVWQALSDPMSGEDHPQHRFHRLMTRLEVPLGSVRPWVDVTAPDPDRNRLISLSLRPAPVTDQWLVEGAVLPDLVQATRNLTLVEAGSPRAEALAIALILRQAAEDGIKAALISPDRDLTRQVTAALDRWAILPDDSAGIPLAQSAPGRLLRHVAEHIGQKLTADALLTLLKHPLAFSGADRGNHLRRTRDLELHMRRHGPAFPTGASILAWASAQKGEDALPWAARVAEVIDGLHSLPVRPLTDHVAHHLALTEALARGTAAGGTGTLWEREDGATARAAMSELVQEAAHGGALSTADYSAVLSGILNAAEVREAPRSHPGIMIWGTLEARVQGADLVILGGLSDGVWPPAPPADPWLNRRMRADAGLLLPERRIGLSAHDYQQAIAAPRVILTRPLRNAEAETVPSRWLNRLMNLMNGLPDRDGPRALEAMRDRGAYWLAVAAALETPETKLPPAHRPSPRPPVSARPDKLPLSRISGLIRDPYAIYARYVLRLQKLDPLRHEADARLRGSVIHLILEEFVKSRPPKTEAPDQARRRLLALVTDILQREVAWPAARAVWQARMIHAADQLIAADEASGGQPLLVEEKGAIRMEPLAFTLHGTPDRIDLLPDGRLHLIDYKTGDPPTAAQQQAFEKQLLLAAAMAERGGFASLGPREVAQITYLGVKSRVKSVKTEMTPEILQETWQGFQRLIGRYQTRSQGYTSRRAMLETKISGEYDHLARFGEWNLTSLPRPEDVG